MFSETSLLSFKFFVPFIGVFNATHKFFAFTDPQKPFSIVDSLRKGWYSDCLQKRDCSVYFTLRARTVNLFVKQRGALFCGNEISSKFKYLLSIL